LRCHCFSTASLLSHHCFLATPFLRLTAFSLIILSWRTRRSPLPPPPHVTSTLGDINQSIQRPHKGMEQNKNLKHNAHLADHPELTRTTTAIAGANPTASSSCHCFSIASLRCHCFSIASLLRHHCFLATPFLRLTAFSLIILSWRTRRSPLPPPPHVTSTLGDINQSIQNPHHKGMAQNKT
jgi:uncharacterized membrane protein